MRLSIHLDDGATIDIAEFDASSALDMADALNEQRFLTFELDSGATVILSRDHIVRLDID